MINDNWILDEEHHGDRRELHAYHASFEDRIGMHRDVMFEIREPVALRADQLPLLHDRE